MSEHRKQRVTVSELLDVRAMEIPSIVEKSPEQIIDDSDRHLDLAKPAERGAPRRKSDDATAHLFATFHADIGDHHFDTSQIAGMDDRDLAKPADPHLTETLDHDLDGPGIEDGDLGGES